jgi:S1-C subfamily serine protease
MTNLTDFSDELADLIDRAAPSVVQVQGRRPASGVVFRDSLVVTTARTLGREDQLKVRTANGGVADAELAGWDPATTLVLLKVAGIDSPPLAPASTAPRVGQLTIAVGRSWSNAVTATTGIVSIIGGPLPTGRGRAIDRVIRTSAPMHAGFAGGAVLNGRGELLGIATAAEIRGLGVIIPADIAWKTAASLADHGTAGRGFIGVAGQAVRLSDRQREALGRAGGLLVVGVPSGSPADSGGILVGDIIVEFDGQAVDSPLDLLELLQGDRVGRAATVKVLRGGAVSECTVTVGQRPAR